MFRIEMEALEIRLQKRVNVSLYALIFLTSLLGLSIITESCQEKREVKVKSDYDHGIAFVKKAH